MNRRNIINRKNKKKSLTKRVIGDIVSLMSAKMLLGNVTKHKEDNTDMVSFRMFFSSMDASHKAVFYNECVNVWGLDKDKLYERSFFVELLTQVQEDNVRAGF